MGTSIPLPKFQEQFEDKVMAPTVEVYLSRSGLQILTFGLKLVLKFRFTSMKAFARRMRAREIGGATEADL